MVFEILCVSNTEVVCSDNVQFVCLFLTSKYLEGFIAEFQMTFNDAKEEN